MPGYHTLPVHTKVTVWSLYKASYFTGTAAMPQNVLNTFLPGCHLPAPTLGGNIFIDPWEDNVKIFKLSENNEETYMTH